MRRKWGFAALALALALCIAGAVFAEDSPLFKAGPYAVRYMANGGTNAPADQIKQHGVPLTLSSQQPVREGYTFVSCNTVADGSGTSWAPGATYTANANLTLYAIWSRVTYTITYNANGGTVAPVPQTKNAGEAVNLSTVIPTRNGYAFLHWNTTSTGLERSLCPARCMRMRPASPSSPSGSPAPTPSAMTPTAASARPRISRSSTARP